MSDHEFYSEEVLFSGDEETSSCLTSTPVTQRWPRGSPTVESNCSPPDWMANAKAEETEANSNFTYYGHTFKINRQSG